MKTTQTFGAPEGWRIARVVAVVDGPPSFVTVELEPDEARAASEDDEKPHLTAAEHAAIGDLMRAPHG